MAVREHVRAIDGEHGSDASGLERAIEAIAGRGRHLDEIQVSWLKGRYLREVQWFERRARIAKRWHYTLRMTALIGGVLVPALIAATNPVKGWSSLRFTASVVSVIVAVAIGVDGFFHWGERWMRYRQTAELLKSEGWSYLEGVGRYQRDHGEDPSSNFAKFATSVESSIHQDVAAFLTTIARDQPAGDQQPTKQQ